MGGKGAQRGSPSKLDEDVIKIVRELRGLGLFQNAIADSLGIDETTLSAWKSQGRKDLKEGRGHTIFTKLFQALKQGEADLRKDCLAKIKKADQWQAHAWRLERCFQDEYGLKSNAGDNKNAEEAIKNVSEALNNSLKILSEKDKEQKADLVDDEI